MAKSTSKPRKPRKPTSSSRSSTVSSDSGSGSNKKKKYSNLTIGKKLKNGPHLHMKPLEYRSHIYSYVPFHANKIKSNIEKVLKLPPKSGNSKIVITKQMKDEVLEYWVPHLSATYKKTVHGLATKKKQRQTRMSAGRVSAKQRKKTAQLKSHGPGGAPKHTSRSRRSRKSYRSKKNTNTTIRSSSKLYNNLRSRK